MFIYLNFPQTILSLLTHCTISDQKFRDPDLPEVIEYLSHPSNAIKANAAAYLQHLCFTNDDVKARTRYFLISN